MTTYDDVECLIKSGDYQLSWSLHKNSNLPDSPTDTDTGRLSLILGDQAGVVWGWRGDTWPMTEHRIISSHQNINPATICLYEQSLLSRQSSVSRPTIHHQQPPVSTNTDYHFAPHLTVQLFNALFIFSGHFPTWGWGNKNLDNLSTALQTSFWISRVDMQEEELSYRF